MSPHAALGALAVVLALTAACADDGLPPGQMDGRTYRSLAATDDLTVDAVMSAGAVRDDRLAATFVAEGGVAAPADLDCYHAETLYRRTTPSKAYRGVARFCFTADGDLVEARRNRTDVPRTD